MAINEAMNVTKRPESLIDCLDAFAVSLWSIFQVVINSSINNLNEIYLQSTKFFLFIYFIRSLANLGPKSINCMHKRRRISCMIEFDVWDKDWINFWK